ncbi:MAG: glycosyltransferase, partial [Candidatus Omnitrophica bacterium]|nr:glycosyltransferase [Candidatus Omnitrophota bacterium]
MVLMETWRRFPTVVVSADYFAAFPGWIASKAIGAHLIYDSHELIVPEPKKSMGLRERFWYWMERLAIRRANLVIAANEERARLMKTHYGLSRMPTVVRNIPSKPEGITDKEKKALLASYPELRRKPNELLILYQGNIDLSRGIGRFVQALSYLPKNYRFIVAGGGPDLEALRKMARPFEFEGRFSLLGKVEHRLMPAVTAMADLGIICYPFHGLNNIFCAPNKLFEYAQAGLPVVATDQPPLRRLVKCYRIGRLVGEHDTPEKIANHIKYVAENKFEFTKGLVRLLDSFQWENEAKRLGDEISHILKLANFKE